MSSFDAHERRETQRIETGRQDAKALVNKYLSELLFKRGDLKRKLKAMNFVTSTSFINLQLEFYVVVRQIGLLDSLRESLMKVEK
jgi:hypothetical protein